jgi:hypothetical protein
MALQELLMMLEEFCLVLINHEWARMNTNPQGAGFDSRCVDAHTRIEKI